MPNLADEAWADEDEVLTLVDDIIHRHYRHPEVSGEDQG